MGSHSSMGQYYSFLRMLINRVLARRKEESQKPALGRSSHQLYKVMDLFTHSLPYSPQNDVLFHP